MAMKLGQYLETSVTDRSRRDYGRKLKEFREYLRDKGKDIDRGEYDDTDVTHFLEMEKDLSPSSMNNHLAIIKAFAGWQMDRINSTFSLEEGDGGALKTMMKRDEVREKLRTVRDIRNYVEEADEEEKNVLTMDQVEDLVWKSSQNDRPIIVMYFYFGLRRMELPTFTNHLDDLDIDEGKVRFDTLKQKRKKRTRVLYFDERVADIFRGWKMDWIRLEMAKDSYYSKVHKYMDEIGVDQLNPTTGRRTFNTHMRDILDDDPLVKSLMGHKMKSSGHTDHYDVTFEEAREKAMKEDHYFNRLDLPDPLIKV